MIPLGDQCVSPESCLKSTQVTENPGVMGMSGKLSKAQLLESEDARARQRSRRLFRHVASPEITNHLSATPLDGGQILRLLKYVDIKIRKKSHDKARKKSGEAASTIAFLQEHVKIHLQFALKCFSTINAWADQTFSIFFSAEENGASQPKEANENLEVIQWP